MLCNTHNWGRKKTLLARVSVVLILLPIVSVVMASPQSEADAIPHVNAKARQGYISYLSAVRNKAFAIAPGGAWAWQQDAATEEEAEELALQRCQSHTNQKCVLYALNNQVVFNSKNWPTLWGPYTSRQQAVEAGLGSKVGQKFYDLSYKDARGRSHSISELKGKVVFVHFWGSWCPPCMREFPALKKLNKHLRDKLRNDVAMVFLHMREPYQDAKRWVKEKGFSQLPVYDSGSLGSDHTVLSLKNGEKIQDRKVARVFPSSYVLDKHGIVVFSHHGPVENWLEYIPFIEHAVQKSGRPGG